MFICRRKNETRGHMSRNTSMIFISRCFCVWLFINKTSACSFRDSDNLLDCAPSCPLCSVKHQSVDVAAGHFSSSVPGYTRSRAAQMSFSPRHVLQLLLGDPAAVSCWMYNLSSVLWVCPGVSSQSNVPGIAPQGSIQGASRSDAWTVWCRLWFLNCLVLPAISLSAVLSHVRHIPLMHSAHLKVQTQKHRGQQ